MSTAEAELVEFAGSLTWEDISAQAQAAVESLVADAIGNAISGRTAADVAALEAADHVMHGAGDSTILAGRTASPVGAAGINAFQVTAQTMCDVYRPGLCHITPEVVPAVLAVGELRGCTGADVLLAAAVGIEATTRICQALNYPSFRARGWHSPGIAGAMGASLAAGRLAGLRGAALAGCLGLAGAQSSGSFAALGTIAVKFHQVRGAQAAVSAAIAGMHGILGSPRVLTAEDGGLLRAYSDASDVSNLTDALGERWELLNISLRAYPAASTLQSLIDCLLALPELEVAAIRDVRIELPPEAYRMGGEAGWGSELRSMQSARYVAAGVIVTRSCWTDLFQQAKRTDPQINELASAISVSANPQLPEGGVLVRLATAAGERTLTREVAPGDPRAPLDDQAIRRKLELCLRDRSIADPRLVTPGSLLSLRAQPDIRALLTASRASV